MDFPFAGNRMLRDLLAAEGIKVGRLRVTTPIKKMAVEAIYRRPNTSKPAPGPKVCPCLLHKLAVSVVGTFGAKLSADYRRFGLVLGLRLGGELAVLQALMFDGLSFDPFALLDNCFSPAEVGIGRRYIAQALVIASVIIVLDERLDLGFEIAGQEVIF